jgi:hypothetical protein
MNAQQIICKSAQNENSRIGVATEVLLDIRKGMVTPGLAYLRREICVV